MRVLWMEVKCIKSVARLLDSNWVNKGGLDLFKEVLWISVGKRAADLRAVKFGGQKKFADQPIANLADRQNFLMTSNFDSP